MPVTLIRNGTLFDGTGADPVPDGAVLVEDGRVRAAGRLADLPRPDTATEEIDAGGGWILPGLIDTHVHLMVEGMDLMRQLSDP
ncbi:MAG: amidohydrolase family protein, partial [Chloroflexia bacterium]|nr:amidohydrolase family protein [Chloroflexia bacterium]